ncbi:MAG: caspase family protein [Leptospiraceae bacterium]|nr:caspase family protein [Leptospiraceae bacterium]MCP5500804.1 caspase family protein [Leptospiraceae bacterium]
MAERNALVIGCSDYKHLTKLKNPVNDAYAIEEALRKVGFDVLCSIDDLKPNLINLINEFSNRIKDRREVALLYYSGHGVQIGGENFLIPVDTENTNVEWLDNVAIPLSKIFNFIKEGKSETNIIILDACRNNPFFSNRRGTLSGGFSERVEIPKSSIISFATGAGAEAGDGEDGKNSIYLSRLLKYLPEPGLKIEDLFKKVGSEVYFDTNGQQGPEMSHNLRHDFYFVPPKEQETKTVTLKLEKEDDDLSYNVLQKYLPGWRKKPGQIFPSTTAGLTGHINPELYTRYLSDSKPEYTVSFNLPSTEKTVYLGRMTWNEVMQKVKERLPTRTEFKAMYDSGEWKTWPEAKDNKVIISLPVYYWTCEVEIGSLRAYGFNIYDGNSYVSGKDDVLHVRCFR